MRSIKQDHFWELKPLPGWEPKDYPDVVTTRKASKELFAKLQWIEGIHAHMLRMTVVCWFRYADGALAPLRPWYFGLGGADRPFKVTILVTKSAPVNP